MFLIIVYYKLIYNDDLNNSMHRVDSTNIDAAEEVMASMRQYMTKSFYSMNKPRFCIIM